MRATAQQGNCGAGFFGKMPSHGDFISRRLPGSFLATWDEWLQTGLQQSREQLGPAWLDTYLNSPIWRFALAPGVCDDSTWAGVLIPSVDRVGRHFPLTLAADIENTPDLLEWLTTSGNWYAQLEDLALSVLDVDFLFTEFDSALSALVLPDPVSGSESARASAGVLRLPLHSVDALQNELPGMLRQMTSFTLAGHAVWWTDGSAHVEPSLLLSRGLPESTAFVGMLDG